MRGTARLFLEEVNTDEIIPTQYAHGDSVLYEHVLEPLRPNFYDEIDDGDIIVAAENFGAGSGREGAPIAIKLAGIGAVVAESFARLFYRNAIGIGLPVITAPGVTEVVSEGDDVAVDLDTGVVRNHTTGAEIQGEPIPEEIQAILEAGGLLAHLEKNPGGLVID